MILVTKRWTKGVELVSGRSVSNGAIPLVGMTKLLIRPYHWDLLFITKLYLKHHKGFNLGTRISFF